MKPVAFYLIWLVIVLAEETDFRIQYGVSAKPDTNIATYIASRDLKDDHFSIDPGRGEATKPSRLKRLRPSATEGQVTKAHISTDRSGVQSTILQQDDPTTLLRRSPMEIPPRTGVQRKVAEIEAQQSKMLKEKLEKEALEKQRHERAQALARQRPAISPKPISPGVQKSAIPQLGTQTARASSASSSRSTSPGRITSPGRTSPPGKQVGGTSRLGMSTAVASPATYFRPVSPERPMHLQRPASPQRSVSSGKEALNNHQIPQAPSVAYSSSTQSPERQIITGNQEPTTPRFNAPMTRNTLTPQSRQVSSHKQATVSTQAPATPRLSTPVISPIQASPSKVTSPNKQASTRGQISPDTPVSASLTPSPSRRIPIGNQMPVIEEISSSRETSPGKQSPSNGQMPSSRQQSPDKMMAFSSQKPASSRTSPSRSVTPARQRLLDNQMSVDNQAVPFTGSPRRQVIHADRASHSNQRFPGRLIPSVHQTLATNQSPPSTSTSPNRQMSPKSQSSTADQLSPFSQLSGNGHGPPIVRIASSRPASPQRSGPTRQSSLTAAGSQPLTGHQTSPNKATTLEHASSLPLRNGSPPLERAVSTDSVNSFKTMKSSISGGSLTNLPQAAQEPSMRRTQSLPLVRYLQSGQQLPGALSVSQPPSPRNKNLMPKLPQAPRQVSIHDSPQVIEANSAPGPFKKTSAASSSMPLKSSLKGSNNNLAGMAARPVPSPLHGSSAQNTRGSLARISVQSLPPGTSTALELQGTQSDVPRSIVQAITRARSPSVQSAPGSTNSHPDTPNSAASLSRAQSLRPVNAEITSPTSRIGISTGTGTGTVTTVRTGTETITVANTGAGAGTPRSVSGTPRSASGATTPNGSTRNGRENRIPLTTSLSQGLGTVAIENERHPGKLWTTAAGTILSGGIVGGIFSGINYHSIQSTVGGSLAGSCVGLTGAVGACWYYKNAQTTVAREQISPEARLARGQEIRAAMVPQFARNSYNYFANRSGRRRSGSHDTELNRAPNGAPNGAPNNAQGAIPDGGQNDVQNPRSPGTNARTQPPANRPHPDPAHPENLVRR